MKRVTLLFVVVLLFCPFVFGQGARYDNFAWQTVYVQGSNVFIGIPNAIVSVCAHPANAVPCTNYATTYTDITLGTSCSTSTPLVLSGSNICVATADINGAFGFWVASGAYDYTVTTTKGSFGPYFVTAGVTSLENTVTGVAPIAVSGGGAVSIQNGALTPANITATYGTDIALFTASGTPATSGDIIEGDAFGGITDSGTLLSLLATLASPTFTGTVTMPAPTLSNILGTAQCLKVSTAGVVSGTGSLCSGYTAVAPLAFSGTAFSLQNSTPANITAAYGTDTAYFTGSGGAATTGDVIEGDAQGGIKDAGVLLSSLAPKASPTFTGTVTIPVTGSTQCLEVNTSGAISGAGNCVPVYGITGTLSTAAHTVIASCVLGTSCSVTLSGAAVFTSSSSYQCSCVDQTSAAACKFAPSSGTAFALTGTSTDTLSFICVGN